MAPAEDVGIESQPVRKLDGLSDRAVPQTLTVLCIVGKL